MTHGATLNSWRTAIGLRLEHVAVITDVSVDTVRNWEADKGPGPGIQHLRLLEEAHGGLLRSLFGDLLTEPARGRGSAA
jgi:transcriptional regulator with XRE-family HTH domain